MSTRALRRIDPIACTDTVAHCRTVQRSVQIVALSNVIMSALAICRRVDACARSNLFIGTHLLVQTLLPHGARSSEPFLLLQLEISALGHKLINF